MPRGVNGWTQKDFLYPGTDKSLLNTSDHQSTVEDARAEAVRVVINHR